jgi:hypothetical protein
MTTAHHTSDGRSTDYGCGFDTSEKDGENVVSHNGEVEGYLAYNVIVPRTRSAVVLLVNDEAIDVRDLVQTTLELVLAQPEDVPKVSGPPAADAARALVAALQKGQLDRSVLGDDFSAYLDGARVAAAAPRLRALGTPKVTLLRQGERGGMEVSVIDLAFASRDVTALLYRSPDGKIHELLMLP